MVKQELIWIEYYPSIRASYPPKPGRYLIYREKCDKMHFETWNGTGWSSSNNDCTHYCTVNKPTKLDTMAQKVYSSSGKTTKNIESLEKKETKKVDKEAKHNGMWEELKKRLKKENEK